MNTTNQMRDELAGARESITSGELFTGDDLAARLAKVEQAEPVAWVPMHPRFGALWAMTTATPSEERLPSHYPLSPLYTRPATPAAKPCRCAEVLADCATTLESYARHHAERGPEHAHKVARNAELAARCRAALAAKD